MKYRKSTGVAVTLAACGLIAFSAANLESFTARAGQIVTIDNAVAGITIPLNNYYASSLNPVEEIKTFLENDITPSESSGEGTVSGNQAESQPETAAEVPSAAAETEPQAPVETAPEAPVETQAKTPAETPAPSPYENIAITHQVKNYVNIRDSASTEGEIVGKIYNKSAATILETVEGEGGAWYRIKSGSVEGFMKAEYFVTGEEAEAVAKEVGTVLGKTTAKTLRLREEPSTESRTLSLLAEGETYIVQEEGIINEAGEEFVKILVNEGDTEEDSLSGYVARQYLDISVKFNKAISIEEERKQKEEEERKAREAKEAKRKWEEAQRAAQQAAAQPAPPASNEGQSEQPQAPVNTESTGNATRDAIVARAQQLIGLPYVWAGTSLTSGTDCSGFTQSVFKEFGVSIPRDSRSQASGSTSISRDSLAPGDLVFYANSRGTINHVGIYIGGGQIIHNANKATGVKVSSVDYASPVHYGRYIN